MSAARWRGGLIGLGAFAAGVAAGAAAEGLLVRRAFARDDPEAHERFGSVRGTPVAVESFDGTRLHVETFGPAGAPAVVFVHGFTLSMDVWHYQLRSLAADGRLRVVAYDARGHGRSGPVRGPEGATPLTPRTLAEDLFAVIHATAWAPTVVVGHSMGGMTLQSLLEYAADFDADVGEHIRGLILVNTTFTAALGAWKGGRVRLPRAQAALSAAGNWLSDRPGTIERLRLPVSDLAVLLTRIGFGSEPSPSHVRFTQRLLHATPAETLAAAVGLGSFDAHGGLEAIDVPALVVAGSRDLVTPPYLAAEMVERIPSAELVVLPGVGHMAMLERHAEFTDLVRRFCERVLSLAPASVP